MKKSKVNFICCFILVMLICFSSVSFAGVTISGILTTTKVEENDQATMRSEQGILIFEGLSYDSNSASYYYMDGGNRVEFSGMLKIPNRNVRNINVSVNSEGQMYIRLPEGISSQELRSAQIVLDNGETISLSNIKIEEKTLTQKEEGVFARIWGFITDAVNEIAKLVEEILNEILLPLGDGLLYIVSRAVGEPVTIDRLIFNKVAKVDVNFWEEGTEGSLKNIMGNVVSYWYNIFRKIAIVVYMIVLVGIGVTIMLNSTAQKKAQYKEALTSWVVGVAILFLFPYVMKYLVELNNAVVAIMERRIVASGRSSINDSINSDFLSGNEYDAYATFGKDEFVYLMIGKDHYNEKTNEIDLSKIRDSMMKTRVLSQKLNKIILTVVYFILIGQTYVLLFAYYKRAFMIAFLITIFPLVAMSYAIDKLGDKKAQSFGIWFKEYTVNVIVQMFHAAVYYLIVNVSVNTFMESNGANWLFMILSVLFLFEGEKILRNIFNVKSSAGTMGDLATTGVAVMSVASQTAKMFGGKKSGGNHMSEDDTQAEKGIDERMSVKSGDNLAAQNARAAVSSGGGAGSTGSTNTASTESSTASAASTQSVSASQTARDKIAKEVFNRKKTAGAFSKGAAGIGKVVGGAMGATYGLATGKGVAGALEGATKGSFVGQTAMTPLSTFANKIDDRISGNRVASSIQKGAMDEYVEQYGDLTAEEAAMARAEAYARASEGEDISDEEVIEKYGTKKQEIMREALAVYAKEAAKHGSSRAKLSFEEYLDTHHL